ncbi:MAG: hypothetical protein ACQEQS_04815 [Thermodesulfobacteriota bacterium]
MKTLNYFLTVLIISAFCIIPSVSAEELKKVFIEEFKIHSPEKNDIYLVSGIETILRSAVESADRTVITNSKDNADFHIAGNVVIAGNTCITTASLKLNGKKISGLNKKGKSKGSILDHINEFSKNLTKKINENEIQKPRTEKEEAVYSKNSDKKNKFLFNTELIEKNIKSVAAEDLNNDNKPEIIWLTDNSLFISVIDNDSLKNLDKKEFKNSIKTLCIETVESMGKKKIIVNSYDNSMKRFYARMFSVSENNKLAEEEIKRNYFYKTVYKHNGNRFLTAKQGGIAGELFYGQIKKVNTETKKFAFTDFKPDNNFEFFPSFSAGFYTQQDSEEWAVLNDSSLKIYSSDFDEIWHSSEKFGGSSKNINIKSKTRDDADKKYFIPQRLVTIPFKDKKSMLLTVQNKDKGKRLFQRIRLFSKGHVKGLVWNKISFDEKFKSPEFSGHIRDFSISDINNDGKKDLITAVSEQFGSFPPETKSRIIITEFEQ